MEQGSSQNPTDITQGKAKDSGGAPAKMAISLDKNSNDSCHVNPSFEEEDICSENPSSSSNEVSAKVLREMLKKTLPDEGMSQTNEEGDLESINSDDGYNSEGLSIADSDNFELFMPETFNEMVPIPNIILSSRRNSRVSGIGQFLTNSRGPSRTASRKFHRSPSTKRRTSTDFIDDRHAGSRRGSRFTSNASRRPSNLHSLWDDNRVISRQNSKKRWESPNVSQFPSRNASVKKQPLNALYHSEEDECMTRCPAKVRLSLTPELISEQFVINKIEEPAVEDMEGIIEEEEDYVEEKAWKKLIKNPQYYKLSFGYMFTRLAQNMTNSYMPLFLTDWLKFPKISIAYFPLVILISGVIASFGGKKLNTILGNKWTFCLGSIMVMGASGWFYLLTPENRSAMYVPAILTGCGSTVMFVTSLALAADFVDADRKSGAFLMGSMGLVSKLFNGILFCLLQEFTPKQVGDSCPECTSYVRHVFSLGPGVSAFFGLIAFILFIPATIHCKPIVQMEDAETQTDELSFTASMTTSLDVIDDQEAMATRRVSCFNVIQEDEEDETMANPRQEPEESGEFDTSL